MADIRDMGESPASVNRIRAPLALATVQHAMPLAHADFERARQAMLREFRRLLEHGTVQGLSGAVVLAGDTQRVMLQLATLLCDPAS